MFVFRKKVAVLLCIGAILISGCAVTGNHSAEKSSKNQADRLSMESTAFMQAMVEKKWDAAYSFFDSTFKKSVSREVFASYPRDTEIKGFSILSVEILPSGKEATVTVTQDLVTKGFTFKGIKKTQQWISEKGKWVILEGPPASMPESSSN